MSHFTSDRFAFAALGVLALASGACGYRVTNERPSFEELDPPEQTVVDRVLVELRALNEEIERSTPFSIAALLDREKIDVSFEHKIFVGNLGDQIVHVSVWENLSASQRALVQTWFAAANPEDARKVYETFFYRFFVIDQGVKQLMYEATSVAWVYGNLSLFYIEDEGMRVALSFYMREPAVLDTVNRGCSQIKNRYESTFGASFSELTLLHHIPEYLNPDAPTGYMYYACRWIDEGRAIVSDLPEELDWTARVRVREQAE